MARLATDGASITHIDGQAQSTVSPPPVSPQPSHPPGANAAISMLAAGTA